MLKKFGLELRRTGSVGNLYRDVDRVLESSGIPSKSVSGNIQLEAISHSLHNMIVVGRHFSVCTIDNCAKISRIIISSERRNLYSSIHCMNWSDMTEDFRTKVVAMVLDDFRDILNYEQIEEIQNV